LLLSVALPCCVGPQSTYAQDVDAEAADVLLLDRERDYQWIGHPAPRCPRTAHSTKLPDIERPSRLLIIAPPRQGHITNAAQVLVNMRTGFRDCYYDFMRRRHGSSGGRVRLAFRVDCDGTITAIRARARGVDRETVACMFRASAGMRFRAPEGGASVVRVPVTFVRVAPRSRLGTDD
jgi:hypothetical protein